MSAITPESYIKLVRFDVTKENQITFPDGIAQVNYFKNTLEGIEAEDFTYIRQEQKIRFPYIIDQIENYNYLIVQNLPYNYKYYFYYITDMKYVNDNMTDVFIKLDVFQTYQFDFIYKKSFIEREHVNNDSIGLHTVPEGLETGEYVVNSYQYETLFDSQAIIVLANKPADSDDSEMIQSATSLGGIFVYGMCYVCESDVDLFDILGCYTYNNYSGGIDSINTMYLVPRSCIDFTKIEEKSVVYSGHAYTLKEYASPVPNVYHVNYAKASSLDGYVPKNKKLLTFPYCFLVGSNNNGNSNVYQYEKFKYNTCDFTFSCVPVAGASIKMTPYNYTENYGYDEEEGLVAGKFPLLNWSSQEYATWLSRNALNLTGQLVIGGLQAVTSAYAGNVEGTANGMINAFNVIKQQYDHHMMPNSSRGNVNGADINIASDNNGFFFYRKSIKREFAEIIDNFFSMYGYKVSTLKLPNITGRRFFNYVKTTQANVESSTVPEKYLKEFKEMLNNGVTFWHDTAHFLDYDVNNTIL